MAPQHHPEDIRIGDLLRNMKVTHLWASVVTVLSLASAAFLLGYQVHSLVSDVGVRKCTISEVKHKFFARYNRYITARDNFEENPSPKNRQTYELAEKMLLELVQSWWTDQNDFSGDLDFQPEVIRKGFDPSKSKVVFADGAEFVIPPEIKKQVLEQNP